MVTIEQQFNEYEYVVLSPRYGNGRIYCGSSIDNARRELKEQAIQACWNYGDIVLEESEDEIEMLVYDPICGPKETYKIQIAKLHTTIVS